MSKTLSISAVAAVSFALAACGGGAESGSGDNLTTVNEVGSLDNGMGANAMGGDTMGATAMAPQEYVTQAASSDMFEIESSQLAANQAENADVKNYARMMIDDHTKTTNELKTIAASVEPRLTVSPTLPPEMQTKLDQLKNAKGAEFDRMYITQQVPAHENALQLHRGFAQNGQEKQLKDFAQKTSEAVQKHLTEAQQISTKMQ